MDILIGTSGWSYDDWVGNFYPDKLKNAKDEWLGYYGKHLGTVEINSTFYRMPEESIINSWIKKGKQFDSFEFSLKLPQLITHEAIVKDSGEKAATIARAFEKKCVQPLAENGLLGAVLIQLSPYFRHYDPKTKADNLPELESVFELIEPDKYRYVVEFRHSSWLNQARNDLVPETIKLLNKFNIGTCQLDGPGFPVTNTITGNQRYIRFHGRNRDIWFKGRKADKTSPEYESGSTDDDRMNRYDYLYTPEELKDWLPRIKDQQQEEAKENSKNKGKGKKTRVYFNNHPNAQAVKNAFMLMDLLGMPRKLMEVKMRKQSKLDFF